MTWVYKLKKMKFKINKDLLPMKGHYFLFNAGVAPVQSFLPLVAKDLNFPSDVFGLISAILPFTGMLAKPLFGAVADRFRLHKAVFICFQILTILGYFNIQFISKIKTDSDAKVKLVCGAETNFHVCFNEPSNPKECLMQDALKESYTNKTVMCSLRCDMSDKLRTELCGPWKANPEICADDGSLKTTLAEYSHVGKEEAGLIETSASDLEDVKLEFRASVPWQHTLRVGDCLYFRVADAQLNDETHHIPYCKFETDTMCKIYCEDPLLSELLSYQEEGKESSSNIFHLYQFWLFLFLCIISWVGMAVVGSVADAVCFEMLGEKANQYGYQRLWGSVGWGSFIIMSGLIIDKFSSAEKTNYTPVFYIMLIVILCDVFCSYYLKYEQTKISTNIFKNVGKLLKDIGVIVFLLWCVVIGMCVGVQWNFLFWHLSYLSKNCGIQDKEKTILGLIGGVQCFLGELPSFFLFGWVVKKLGHINLMTLIPFVVGFRFIIYSFLPNPWWSLPIEVLQCSIGFSFAIMASYASIVAPPGTEATVQGLVGAIFEGIGVSLGSFLGGLIIKQYDSPTLFKIFGIVAFAMGVTHGIVQYLLGKNSKLNTQTKETTDDEGMTSDSSMETTY